MERFALRMALCLIFLTMCATVDAAGCYWDLNKDIPKKDPLYFTNTNPPSLIIPGPNGIELQINDKMTLTCLGNSNYILIASVATPTGLQELTVQCDLNNKLLYNNAQYDLNQFTCSANSLSDVDFPGTSCSNGRGEIMKLGFKIRNRFFSQVTVCYDRSNEASLYAVNTIYGKSIKKAEKRGPRSDFRNHGLTNAPNTVTQYTQLGQTTQFFGLLGMGFSNYITQRSYLARGHLAPDADFLFGSWGSATYFYVNAVPQWQEINTKNWIIIENNARNIADSTQDDLMIFTGTYEVLKLPTDFGKMEDIFLFDPKKLPVPMWMWKIVYSQKTQLGIAFVTLNNPYATRQTAPAPICTDICAPSLWSRPEFSDYARGYTYCCNVNALLAKVGTLSPPINVAGILNGPLTSIG